MAGAAAGEGALVPGAEPRCLRHREKAAPALPVAELLSGGGAGIQPALRVCVCVCVYECVRGGVIPPAWGHRKGRAPQASLHPKRGILLHPWALLQTVVAMKSPATS